MATVVKHCGCTGVQDFEVKSAGGKARSGVRPKQTVPWMTTNAGAAYQDEKYGKGMRLHNIGGKTATKTATCTVCNKQTTV